MATFTWNGSSGLWTDVAQWSIGGVPANAIPGRSDIAIAGGDASYTITVVGQQTVDDFTLDDPNAELLLGDGIATTAQLTAGGGPTINAGTVAAGAAASFIQGGSVTNNGTILSTGHGAFQLAMSAQNTFINNGLISIDGDTDTISSPFDIVNTGTIAVTGAGMLNIVGTFTNQGVMTMASGATLDLGVNNPIISGTVQFLDASASTLSIRTSGTQTISTTVVNFRPGNTIDLPTLSFTDTETASLANNTIIVSDNGTQVFSIPTAGIPVDTSFLVADDGRGNAQLTSLLCFTAGTRIDTPRGEVLVEQLSVGDEVVTHAGKVRPITWVGTGCVSATRGQRTAATPVIIRKGAIADNEPYQDLRVTKGHSLYIDRVLIPVEFLVNHRSILWDDRAQEVSIYHLELEAHEVLLANGAAAESYRDDGNRWLFNNTNPAWSFPPKQPFAPVMTGGPIVDAIWQRLLERSGARPGFPLTDDPDLHLLVDGRRVDPRMDAPDARYVFRLQAPPGQVRIVSRAGAPSELGLSRDPRPLGVAVHRIVIQDGIARRTVEATESALRDGFHGYEPDERIRWTNGNAVLPAALFSACSGPLDIEIITAGATRYLDEGMPVAA